MPRASTATAVRLRGRRRSVGHRLGASTAPVRSSPRAPRMLARGRGRRVAAWRSCLACVLLRGGLVVSPEDRALRNSADYIMNR